MRCIRFECNEAPAALGGLLLVGDVGCEGELSAYEHTGKAWLGARGTSRLHPSSKCSVWLAPCKDLFVCIIIEKLYVGFSLRTRMNIQRIQKHCIVCIFNTNLLRRACSEHLWTWWTHKSSGHRLFEETGSDLWSAQCPNILSLCSSLDFNSTLKKG
jgi:hypothetical protein